MILYVLYDTADRTTILILCPIRSRVSKSVIQASQQQLFQLTVQILLFDGRRECVCFLDCRTYLIQYIIDWKGI